MKSPNRRLKKSGRILLAYLLCLFMTLGSFSGCANKATEPKPSSLYTLPEDVDTQQHMEISIGFWNVGDMLEQQEPDPLLALIQDLFNVTIQPVSVEWSEYKVDYQIMGVTDSLPDVFATLTISSSDSNDSSSLTNLITQELIRPLPEDLSSFPHVEKIFKNLPYLPHHDGAYYYIPRLTYETLELTSTDAGMLVRKDWMKTLGYQNPSSFDEFVKMCESFAKDDPDGNGIDDTIGYNVNNLDVLGKWLIFGIAPECNGFSWVESAPGEYQPYYVLPEFKTVVSAFRTLYEKGALDPHFHIKKTEDAITDFARGRLGALEYKTSPEAVMELKEQWDLGDNPPFEESVDFLKIFRAPDGNRYSNLSNPFWSESLFSSKVSQEKMERILALYDFLLSPEGNNLIKYGIPGTDYVLEHGVYTSLLPLEGESVGHALREKYPSLELFSTLASWGGSDSDFQLSSHTIMRYGEGPATIAAESLAWNRENTLQKERPFDFLLFPKESTPYFSHSQIKDDFITVVIGSGDPELMWDNTLERYYEQGLESYIVRQNKRFQDEKGAS